ncbi:hypothetical protein [Inhella sp.]|uniref:hypothetical protein n=1 Tax=Inhella sp. TaxID=1921806 RepID=UPI0035AE5986
MHPEFGPKIAPHRRRPVAWYAPPVLWAAARKLLAAQQFAEQLDRRDTFPPQLQPLDLSADDAPFWFDFVSDTGYGGDATFAVAQGLLAPSTTGTQALDENGQPLPEGRLLVLGGDLAYPGSGRLDYQYRFIEPFEQAQAWARSLGPSRWRCDPAGAPGSDDKLLLAIPQNHDWAVSCSAFCRYFVSHHGGAVLGARTPQRQTWFAARLPQGWWLLGLDFALEGDIDRNQYEGFLSLLHQGLGEGSQVLLVYPEPYWTRPLGDDAPRGYPKRYQRLEARLLAAGARIRLRLAGDLHHYAHDQLQLPDGSDTHLVVAGHGGAFTHATHTVETRRPKVYRHVHEDNTAELAQHLEVGLARSAEEATLPAFEQGLRYPRPLRTRRAAWTAWTGLFRFRASGWGRPPKERLHELWQSNLGLLPLLGFLIGVLTWFAYGIHPDPLTTWVPSPTAVLPALAVLAACTAAIWEPLAPWRSLGVGLAHGAAQLLAAFMLTVTCFGALNPWLAWPVFVAVAAGVSALLLGGALAMACGVLNLASNACSGLLASEQHKGFLRLRIGEDGALTVFALGLDRVPARHRLPAAGEPLPARWRVVERFSLNR